MNISFKIRSANTNFGESVFVVGSGVSLGDWNQNKALTMSTNEKLYPMWITQEHVYVADMNQARDIEYKYLIKSSQKSTWEDKDGAQSVKDPHYGTHCSNRKVDVSCYFDSRKFNHVVIEDMGFNNFSKPTLHVIYEDDVESSYWSRNLNRDKKQGMKFQKSIHDTSADMNQTTVDNKVPKLDFNIIPPTQISHIKNRSKSQVGKPRVSSRSQVEKPRESTKEEALDESGLEFEEIDSEISNNDFDNAKQILFEKLRQSRIQSHHNSVIDEQSINQSPRNRHSEIGLNTYERFDHEMSFQMPTVHNINNEMDTEFSQNFDQENMQRQFANMQKALEKKIQLQDEKILKQTQEIYKMREEQTNKKSQDKMKKLALKVVVNKMVYRQNLKIKNTFLSFQENSRIKRENQRNEKIKEIANKIKVQTKEMMGQMQGQNICERILQKKEIKIKQRAFEKFILNRFKIQMNQKLANSLITAKQELANSVSQSPKPILSDQHTQSSIQRSCRASQSEPKEFCQNSTQFEQQPTISVGTQIVIQLTETGIQPESIQNHDVSIGTEIQVKSKEIQSQILSKDIETQISQDIKDAQTQSEKIEENGPVDVSFQSFKSEEKKEVKTIMDMFGGFFQSSATTPKKVPKGAVIPKKEKIPEEQKKVATPREDEKEKVPDEDTQSVNESVSDIQNVIKIKKKVQRGPKKIQKQENVK